MLRKKAVPVTASEFGTKEFTKILNDMEQALDSQADGVALAAPQIGISKRIFIVRYDRMAPPPEEGEKERPVEVGVFINPEFVRKARKKAIMDEGCLSVRGKYGQTKRHERATVTAQDASGKKFERGGGGILAQAFQHEIDHLDGILFIDHATEVHSVDDAGVRKSRRTEGWIPEDEAHA